MDVVPCFGRGRHPDPILRSTQPVNRPAAGACYVRVEGCPSARMFLKLALLCTWQEHFHLVSKTHPK